MRRPTDWKLFFFTFDFQHKTFNLLWDFLDFLIKSECFIAQLQALLSDDWWRFIFNDLLHDEMSERDFMIVGNAAEFSSTFLFRLSHDDHHHHHRSIPPNRVRIYTHFYFSEPLLLALMLSSTRNSTSSSFFQCANYRSFSSCVFSRLLIDSDLAGDFFLHASRSTGRGQHQGRLRIIKSHKLDDDHLRVWIFLRSISFESFECVDDLNIFYFLHFAENSETPE